MRNFCGSTKEQLNCKANTMEIHMTERIAYTVKEAAAALGVSEWMVREETSITGACEGLDFDNGLQSSGLALTAPPISVGQGIK